MQKQGYSTPPQPAPDDDPSTSAAADPDPVPDAAPWPGGGDSTWSVVRSITDRKGKSMPLRTGNASFGMRHLRANHNITSASLVYATVRADTSPNTETRRGPNRPQYEAVTYYSNNPWKSETIVVGGQYTRGGSQPSSVSGPLGVITAYCKGKSVCPTWVNGYVG
ncbi:hypothetical protein WDZ17_17035 [Pseudokineococcus basanitobsidens]|uniref:Uncharacterized protein n=1 Tax=Pseudokineococcus basanitobsidens TaxID=1926649 RepID=A0ABU8RPH2_9ACTN